MRHFFLFLFFFYGLVVLGQVRKTLPIRDGIPPQMDNNGSTPSEDQLGVPNEEVKATVDLFRYMNMHRDTVFVDTSLTLQKEYEHNYLRRDLFGLLAFSNEGQVYNTLQYSQRKSLALPTMGFRAKHFNYMEIDEIPYFSVAQPFSEVMYRSVMEQGQILDAQFAVNTSPRLNFFMGYKGTRSLGNYVNQLASHGNFRFSSHYHSKNNRYHLFTHFTGQDLTNNENGGIINTVAFEQKDEAFDDRARFDVYFRDARSFLKGHRLFVDHQYALAKEGFFKDFSLVHRFTYEYKMFRFSQNTVNTIIDGSPFQRLGNAFVNDGINNETRFEQINHVLGAKYHHSKLGNFEFLINQVNNELRYNKVLFLEGNFIPSGINESITLLSGSYHFDWKGFDVQTNYVQSITDQGISDLNAKASYEINPKHRYEFGYRFHTQVADYMNRLHQSSYAHYNWFQDFKTQKNTTLHGSLTNPWLNIHMEVSQISDFLYFSNDAPIVGNTQLQQIRVTPKQFSSNIQHISMQVSRVFTHKNFGFDSRLLFQEVYQSDAVLNVPRLTTRNSLYYGNHFFKKALFLQTGITAHYFTKYYADDFNPLLGSFFAQNQMEIGNYPVFDWFVNAKIKTFRLFIRAEHLNAAFNKTPYYSAPNQPYRDFILRFGLTWNFFQ